MNIQPKWLVSASLLLLLSGCNSAMLYPVRAALPVPTPVIGGGEEGKKVELSVGYIDGTLDNRGQAKLDAVQGGIAHLWEFPLIQLELGALGHWGRADLRQYKEIDRTFSTYGFQVRGQATPFIPIFGLVNLGVPLFIRQHADFGSYPDFNRSFKSMPLEGDDHLNSYDIKDWGLQIGIGALLQINTFFGSVGLMFAMEKTAQNDYVDPVFALPIRIGSWIIDLSTQGIASAEGNSVTIRKIL